MLWLPQKTRAGQWMRKLSLTLQELEVQSQALLQLPRVRRDARTNCDSYRLPTILAGKGVETFMLNLSIASTQPLRATIP